MIHNILFALFAVLIITLLSSVGIFTLLIKNKSFDNLIHYLVPFSIGTLLAVTFFELLPDAVEFAGGSFKSDIGILIISSMAISFILEYFIHWHHHVNTKNKSEEEIKPYVYNILYGDGVHNFIDGIALVIAFNSSLTLGLSLFLGIAIHELAQEIGDFTILVKGGMSPIKALFYNFISGLTAFLGAFVGILLISNPAIIVEINIIVLSLTAGTFLYLSSADLIPELAEELSLKKTIFHLITAGLGVILILILS